jgi:hypothetical protein
VPVKQCRHLYEAGAHAGGDGGAVATGLVALAALVVSELAYSKLHTADRALLIASGAGVIGVVVSWIDMLGGPTRGSLKSNQEAVDRATDAYDETRPSLDPVDVRPRSSTGSALKKRSHNVNSRHVKSPYGLSRGARLSRSLRQRGCLSTCTDNALGEAATLAPVLAPVVRGTCPGALLTESGD